MTRTPEYSDREWRSPSFNDGWANGNRDALRTGMCPPLPPIGPASDGAMYLRGYHRSFDAAVPHVCTDKCRRKAAG